MKTGNTPSKADLVRQIASLKARIAVLEARPAVPFAMPTVNPPVMPGQVPWGPLQGGGNVMPLVFGGTINGLAGACAVPAVGHFTIAGNVQPAPLNNVVLHGHPNAGCANPMLGQVWLGTFPAPRLHS